MQKSIVFSVAVNILMSGNANMAAAYCYEGIPLRFLASLSDIQMRYLVYMRYLWSRSLPADLNHKTLYVSQLLSNPTSKYSHSHITRHPTSTKPLLSNTKSIRGFRIPMNFSISMILIFLSKYISTNPGPNCCFSIPPNVRALRSPN